MSLFTKTIPQQVPVSTVSAVDLTATPELWAPEHLLDEFAAVDAERRAAITPYAHPDWLAWLRGADVVQMSKDPRPVGPLATHLRAALAAIHHDGIDPASVPPFVHPRLQRRKSLEPVRLAAGEGSYVLSQLADDFELTSEDIRARDLHDWARKHGEEFNDLWATQHTAVLSDARRAWAAFQHLTLLDITTRRFTQREAAAKAERERLAVQQCPVCSEHDPFQIGQIRLRALLPHLEFVVDGVPALRSCLKCWNTASAAHVATVAAESIHGTRRVDLVTQRVHGGHV